MLKVNLYNFEGKKKDDITLPKEYDVKPNLKLLSQSVHVYEDRKHLGLARAKTRSEVSISTRKIYRQKGTGGARHGPKSAPIFVGGGVAHGPKGIKRTLKLSKSQKERALFYAFNYKITASRLVLVEDLEKIKKTKDAFGLIKGIINDKGWKNKKNIIVALSEKNKDLAKIFRNIKGVTVDNIKNLNAYRVYLANELIIDKAVFEQSKEKRVDLKEKVQATKTGKQIRISGVSGKGKADRTGRNVKTGKVAGGSKKAR